MEEIKWYKKGKKNERNKYNNSIEHRPREADSCQPVQNIPYILLYTIYMITFTTPRPLIPSLSQMN
jgi:hypothetical protein